MKTIVKIIIIITLAHWHISTLIFAQQFTEIADSVGLKTPNSKDGGVSWGDFNNDGCLDLIVNTDAGVEGTRLYLSDCN